MAKIYTKVGDKGMTGLIGGQKVPKTNIRIHAYGTVDELNSFTGYARVEFARILKELGTGYVDVAKVDAFSRMDADLEKFQHWFFDLGALLACEKADQEKYKLQQLTPQHISSIETRIDEMTALLPPLKEFILPGGSEAASRVHLLRTISRRAERCLVEMGDDLPELAIPFINRVSDYFFVLARFVNAKLDVDDVTWKKQDPSR